MMIVEKLQMKYNRVYNFSPGPSMIPTEVLEKAREELLNYQNSGMSVMEMSHRSREFMHMMEQAEADVRDILNVPDNYSVIFLQGGASLQFCMVPMNLSNSQKTVDVIQTGSWTKKAAKEIARISKVHIVASTEDENFARLPRTEELKFSKEAAYVHIASNNTIFGTQMNDFPDTKDVPLVADMSSDILSRKINISKFGLIFASSQKNLAPAGVVLVIIRNDLLEKAPKNIPIFLQYKTHVESRSLYHTPPTFMIYMLGLTLQWIKKEGGLEGIERRNQEKARILYDAIDSNDLYYCPVKEKGDRSIMNVVFRIQKASEDPEKERLENIFFEEANKKGITNIKGHRSVGGLRASIYNAMPQGGVHHLVGFMEEFSKKYLT